MSNQDELAHWKKVGSEFSRQRLAESWLALCDAWDSLLDQQRRERGEPIPTHREAGLGLSAAGDVMMAVSSIRDACMLPDLAALLGPLASLQWYGPPDKLQGQIVAVKEGATAIEDLRGFPGWEEMPSSKDLHSFANECERLLPALRLAVEYVERFGFRFDAKSRQVRLKTGRRGRPTLLLTAIVGSVFENVCPPNRRTTRKDPWYSQRIREQISQVLSPHFPPEWTDPKRGGVLEGRVKDYVDNKERYHLKDLLPGEFRTSIPVPQHIFDALPPGLAQHLAGLAGQIPP